MQGVLCETLLGWPSSAYNEFFKFPNVLHKHEAESAQSCTFQCSEKAGVDAYEKSRHWFNKKIISSMKITEVDLDNGQALTPSVFLFKGWEIRDPQSPFF